MTFHEAFFQAPLPNLLIASGVVFLFIAIVGELSGKFTVGEKGRVAAGLIGPVLLIIGLLMAFGWLPPTSESEGFRVRSASVGSIAANPASVATIPNDDGIRDYEGTCPVTIHVGAEISAVGGSGTVTYQWKRPDTGYTSDIHTIEFDKPRTKRVVLDNVTIGDQPNPDRRTAGTRASYSLHILEPNSLTTEIHKITVMCDY